MVISGQSTKAWRQKGRSEHVWNWSAPAHVRCIHDTQQVIKREDSKSQWERDTVRKRMREREREKERECERTKRARAAPKF